MTCESMGHATNEIQHVFIITEIGLIKFFYSLAEDSDFEQALIVDLGFMKNVTGIATQGRAHSDEFVKEFRVQYGSNGKDWIDYKEVDGSPKLFLGKQ